MTNTQSTQQDGTAKRHPYGLDMATACGHVIPYHHRMPWHDGESYYCSLRCISAALASKRQSSPDVAQAGPGEAPDGGDQPAASDSSSEDEATRFRRDIETYRAYLAGPCDHDGPTAPRCPSGPYDGHRHYSAWYEAHRSTVVALNAILGGEFPRSTWEEMARAVDPDEM